MGSEIMPVSGEATTARPRVAIFQRGSVFEKFERRGDARQSLADDDRIHTDERMAALGWTHQFDERG